MSDASRIVSNGIVVEPLNKENYSTWSALMKNYLMGKHLWENIIEDNDKSEENKDKNVGLMKSKNSKALHAIQLSCGHDALVQIRHSADAKHAWNLLKTSFSEDVRAHTDSFQTRSSDSHRIHLQSLVKKGFLDEAKSSINVSPEDIFFRSPDGRTVLHAAVAAGHMELVKKLVKMGKQRLVKIQDKKGYTALALAAKLTDNKDMVEWMVKYGGEEQVTIKLNLNGVDEIPVLLASDKGHKEITRYLFNCTPWSVLRQNRWEFGVMLLSRCIYNEIFDVAAAILQHHDSLQLPLNHPGQQFRPIYALAHIPSAFPRAATQTYGFWRHLIYIFLRPDTTNVLNDERIEIVSHVLEPDEEGPNVIMTHTLAGRLFGRVQQFVQTKILLKLPVFKKIHEEKQDHYLVLEILNYLCKRISTLSETQVREASAYDAILQAAKYGIIEFIESMSKANPDLLTAMDQSKRGIFAHAILNRREEVFQLIHQMHGIEIIASSEDVLGNNLLHIAADLGPSSYLDRISNAALQMQRELQWFQEVKRVMPRWCHEAKDSNSKMASDVFSENHKELLKSGQQWAKETASSFTLVGTLIITIMFAAAFTVPGGNESDDLTKKGLPVFLGKDLFTFFIISDAISLVTSSSSVLMFIGILTSRYAEEDFNKSLPFKLLFGLVTLFFSVASMMCAFCGALALMLKGYNRIVIAAMWLAILPIMVFIPSLLRLTSEIFQSTMRFNKPAVKKKKNQPY